MYIVSILCANGQKCTVFENQTIADFVSSKSQTMTNVKTYSYAYGFLSVINSNYMRISHLFVSLHRCFLSYQLNICEINKRMNSRSLLTDDNIVQALTLTGAPSTACFYNTIPAGVAASGEKKTLQRAILVARD